MSLFSFVQKQFIDVIEWQEEEDGILAWRYPMADNEIQNGASLTVRESQVAVFLNEGKIADVFGPGRYTLTTQTLPVLTSLRNWDKLFDSPFKSDVYFFSTREQIGRKWGTAQAVTVRDKDFGMVRLRAFGIYSYHTSDVKALFGAVSGTRASYTCEELEQQLRNVVVATMTRTLGESAVPFLDMAANQGLFAQTIQAALMSEFQRLGLSLDSFVVENISLPEELQKALDKRIAMGMAGDLTQYTRYQAAESLPLAAQNEGGLAALGASFGAGAALGQVLTDALRNESPSPSQNPAPGVAPSAPAAAVPAPASAPSAADGALQQRLAQLKTMLEQGLITQADYDSSKAEVLKKWLDQSPT